MFFKTSLFLNSVESRNGDDDDDLDILTTVGTSCNTTSGKQNISNFLVSFNSILLQKQFGFETSPQAKVDTKTNELYNRHYLP